MLDLCLYLYLMQICYIIMHMKRIKMTRIESGVVARLPYALTDSQCSNWGMQLEWDCVFDNVSLPKYAAKHCG